MLKHPIYNESYLIWQKDRNPLRKWVRKNLYLKKIKSLVIGNAIDFGCGSGELLNILSPESKGFDINQAAVDYCNNVLNLNIDFCKPNSKSILTNIKKGEFSTFIMAHVLEHLDEPEIFFKKIIRECNVKGIDRLIFIVPCKKGFHSLKEHIHFIDRSFFINFNGTYGYNITFCYDFPFNFKMGGNLFTYNELNVIFDKYNQ